MKKILYFILLLFFIGCDANYTVNKEINNRKPPIVVIAMDSAKGTVVFKDGNNQIFTISNSPTTIAINNSCKVGDTIRTKSGKYFYKKF